MQTKNSQKEKDSQEKGKTSAIRTYYSDIEENEPQDKKQKADRKDKRASLIRTYYSDTAGIVKNKGLSVVDIALKEQNRRETNGENVSSKNKNRRGVFFALFGIVLLASSVGIFFFLNEKSAKTSDTKIVVEKAINSLVKIDTSVAFNIGDKNKSDLLSEIADFIATENSQGLTELEIGNPKTFLEILGASVDQAFLRSLTDKFLFGVYNKKQKSVVMIFKTDIFENGFAGMLNWETALPNDLPFLIPKTEEEPTNNQTSTSTQSSSTTEENNLGVETPVWSDSVIENRDVRIFSTPETEFIFYSFVDKNTFVITNTKEGLAEMFSRLKTVEFE